MVLEDIQITLPREIFSTSGFVIHQEPPLLYRLTTTGMPVREMQCLATVFHTSNEGQIIVLTEYKGNSGPSVTNCAEALIPAVFRDLATKPIERVRFIEHYRDDLSYGRLGDRETFDWMQTDIVSNMPVFKGWQPIRTKRLALG